MGAEYRLQLAEYDPAWPEVFALVRPHLESGLRGIDHRIEHVGSTAVPDLPAKPIIDIDVVVQAADVPKAIEAIVRLGYIHKGTRGVPGRETFNLPEGLPQHHLYLVVDGSKPHLDHVLFRDLLRSEPSLVTEYAAEKRRHAHLLPDNRAGYTDAKSAFIEDALVRARQTFGIPPIEDPVFDGVTYRWRAQVQHEEVESIIASAFGSPPVPGWFLRIRPIALGWVSAHENERLVGFVTVAWDGAHHASLFDTAVLPERQHRGIGTRLVVRAAVEARRAGCRWLHVDFEESLAAFYSGAGFAPTAAGLMHLDAAESDAEPAGPADTNRDNN